MTGEPMHTASKERMTPELMFSSERMPQLSKTVLKVQWPLCFAFSYVQPVTQCYKQRTALENHLCNQSSHHGKYGRFSFTNVAISGQQQDMDRLKGLWPINSYFLLSVLYTCP